MSERADVCIVGGGVMGLFLAFHLRRQGVARVVLAEKRFCGAGSSGKSGAICRQHYSNEVTAGLARDALVVFSEFAAHFGNDGGFRRTGCLFFAPPGHADTMRKNVALQRSWGISTEMVDLHRAESLEPRFDLSDGPAACFEPDAGYCDPLVVLAGVEAACGHLGVEMRIGERALRIEVGGERVKGAVLESGETVGADVVVNCAGPWAAGLAKSAGVEVPIRATKPQIAFTRRPADSGGESRGHPVVCDLVNSYYARPDLPGQTLIGGLDMEADPPVPDPDAEQEGIEDGVVAELNTRLVRRFPAMSRGRSRGGMGALYACTPDYHPVIGPQKEVGGLWTCAGFSGHGFKFSPEIGRALAGWIVGGSPTDHDLTIFRPQRFAEGKPVRGRYEYSILG